MSILMNYEMFKGAHQKNFKKRLLYIHSHKHINTEIH